MNDNIEDLLKANKVIVIYDGICNLCDFSMIFLLNRNVNDRLSFIPYQSLENTSFNQYNIPKDLSSIILLEYDKIKKKVIVFKKSTAFLKAGKYINFPWNYISSVLSYIPTCFSDLCYDIVAKNRYKLFGKVKNSEIYMIYMFFYRNHAIDEEIVWESKK